MKAFRMPGPLEDESPALARLFELGCVGVAEEPGPAGPDTVAYFAAEVDLPFAGRWEDVAEADHVAAYRAGLDAVRVGPVVVAPTHRRVRLSAGEQVVWLDPGQAFGTGHHETTRLALGALAGLRLDGRSVLDVGTGSGVLAIAADRLGAQTVLGIDIDASSVRVARENAALNRSRARFLAGGIDHPDLPRRFDVIVANLYAELHVAQMPAYLARLGRRGRLLLTGVLADLGGAVQDAIPSGARCEVRRDGEWLLLDVRGPS